MRINWHRWSRAAWIWTTRLLVNHGRHPLTVALFATVAAADSVLPVLPAEILALALMLLQPHRAQRIGLVFAGAAAVSALLLASLLAGVAGSTGQWGWLDLEMTGPAWDQAKGVIAAWGAPALAVVSIFPDSPRTSVAVATLAGMAPPVVASMVLVGKLALYMVMALLVAELPRLLRFTAGPGGARFGWLHRRTRRLAAYQRLLKGPQYRDPSSR